LRVEKKDAFQIQAFERRKKVNFAGFDVWIISAEDLILAKLIWAKASKSEMPRRDVANLLQTRLDLGYIRSWAVKPGVDNTLTAISDELGN
jgi:hypothetical protein